MSAGWSLWVMFLVVLNLGITLFLFLWGPHVKIPVQPDQTTGHAWAHGTIREGLRPLPRWWLLLSASMFVGGIGYLVLYPGFGNHKGLLHWTAHGQLARAVAANDAKLAPLMQRFRLYPVEQLAGDPDAQQLGRRLFDDNCAACHGRDARGNQALGAPDLTDDDWLYGGTGKDIASSIHDGRGGVMPPWNSLGKQTDANLAQYVLGLSGAPHDAAMAAAAEPIFKATCAACHGADGKGNQGVGAPNLTDRIWLHGGSPAEILATIRDGRQGHMPNWDKRLDDDQIHVLAAFVYHLSHPDADTP
jgi:cytochrome c oxidase cbb3-type subunit 3